MCRTARDIVVDNTVQYTQLILFQSKLFLWIQKASVALGNRKSYHIKRYFDIAKPNSGQNPKSRHGHLEF
jgi:hypothetical protein